MTYLTVDRLRAYLGVHSDSDDALLQELIAAAVAEVELYAGFSFEAASDTVRTLDYRRNVAGRLLTFDTWLAAAPTTVKTDADGANLTVPSTDYVLRPTFGAPYWGLELLESSAYSWTYSVDPAKAITVTGRWGYSATPPANVVQVVRRLASFMYRQKGTSSDVDRALVLADGSMALPAGIPKDGQLILDQYLWRTS